MSKDVPKVSIDDLAQKGTAGDGSIALSLSFIFAMTLVKDTSPCCIEFCQGHVGDITDEGIDKMLQVLHSSDNGSL